MEIQGGFILEKVRTPESERHDFESQTVAYTKCDFGATKFSELQFSPL